MNSSLQFEQKVEHMFQRRFQHWCRLCISSTCVHDIRPTDPRIYGLMPPERLREPQKIPSPDRRSKSKLDDKSSSPSHQNFGKTSTFEDGNLSSNQQFREELKLDEENLSSSNQIQFRETSKSEIKNSVPPINDEPFYFTLPSKNPHHKHQHQLKIYKEKRLAVEKYLKNLEKFSNSLQLKYSRLSHFGHQHQEMPTWLQSILAEKRELTIPLVPLFLGNDEEIPRPGIYFKNLPKLPEDCKTSSSRLHRLRLTYPKLEKINANIPLTAINLSEETSNAEINSQIKGKGKNQAENESKINSILEILSKTQSSTHYREIEKLLKWNLLYKTAEAHVEVCQFDRVLIKGHFNDSLCEQRLNFTLFIFPKWKERSKHFKVYGRFVRQSPSSQFNLSWRYHTKLYLRCGRNDQT